MNKNQKVIRRAINAAAKAKRPTVDLNIPVGTNHKIAAKSNVSTVQRQVSFRNKEGEVSRNEKRNSRMIVMHNKGEDGRCFSVTRHVKIDPAKPFRGRSRGERAALLAELSNLGK